MTSNIKLNRFFISDNHWGHANIIKYCSRPYDSVESMDADMINKWNSVVNPDDEAWHLGDVAMSYERAKQVVPLLNGKKYLILGNHDKSAKLMVEAGFIAAYQSWKLKIGIKTVHLQHRPKVLTGYDQGRWQIHGHVHNKSPLVDRETRMINVSVENIDYTPINESEIIKLMR